MTACTIIKRSLNVPHNIPSIAAGNSRGISRYSLCFGWQMLHLKCNKLRALPRQRCPQIHMMVNPVVWSSLAGPIHPVKGTDGQIHLIYGLDVSNASRHDVRLTSIEVLDEQEKPITGTNKVVSADGQDVTGKLRPFSLPNPTEDTADFTDRLGPGQGGVVYFDITYSYVGDIANVNYPPLNDELRFVAIVGAFW